MKEKLKLYLTVLLFLVGSGTVTTVSAAETAADVMARCAATVNKAASLDVKFYLTAGSERYNCEMVIAKSKFTLTMPGMHVWYDGTTQWTLATESGELSITEPTADELMESNPFAIINYYSKAYNCRLLAPDNGMKRIELTPKARGASVRKAEVSINPKTNLPQKVIITLSNGRVVAATVSDIKSGAAPKSSVFTYDKAKYPAKEIIDLR